MPTFENYSTSFEADTPVRVVAPASGTTVTMRQQDRLLFVNNNAGLAALTIKLPGGASHGDRVEIGVLNAVKALTILDNSGNPVVGPGSASPYSAIVFRYLNTRYGGGSSIKQWVYWQ